MFESMERMCGRTLGSHILMRQFINQLIQDCIFSLVSQDPCSSRLLKLHTYSWSFQSSRRNYLLFVAIDMFRQNTNLESDQGDPSLRRNGVKLLRRCKLRRRSISSVSILEEVNCRSRNRRCRSDSLLGRHGRDQWLKTIEDELSGIFDGLHLA